MEHTQNGNDIELIIKATNFSALAHRHQKRKGADAVPYINHPIGVAQILSDEGKINDVSVLVAALLHDTVEDTSTTLDDLEREFGSEIRDIVAECSEDKSRPRDIRKREHTQAMSSHCHKAKLIHLADKLYNMRDTFHSRPVGWDDNYVRQYFLGAKSAVDQCRGTNIALETLCDEMITSKLAQK